MDAKEGFEHISLDVLKHTYEKPGEWIGTTADGKKVHILERKSALHIALGDSIEDCIRQHRSGNTKSFPHKFYGRISTDEMLTVIKLKSIKEVKECVPNLTKLR